MFSKWSGGLKKKCVGFHHFLLTMIFWWPRNLNYQYKKRRKLLNIMEVGFFCQASSCTIFFVHLTICYYIFQRRCGKKKNNIVCYLNFRCHITNFCSYYFCCKIFELFLLLLWLLWKQIEEEICRKNVNHWDIIPLGV